MKKQLNRIQYASRLLPTYIVFGFLFTAIVYYLGGTFDPAAWEAAAYIGLALMFAKMFIAATTLYVFLFLPLTVMFVVQRLRDLHVNGWWGALAVIPVVGQILAVALIVPAGASERNTYDAQ